MAGPRLCKTCPIPFADLTPSPRSRDGQAGTVSPSSNRKAGKLIKLFAPCPAPQEASQALQKCTWISLIWHPKLHFHQSCQHFFPLSRHQATLGLATASKTNILGLVASSLSSIVRTQYLSSSVIGDRTRLRLPMADRYDMLSINMARALFSVRVYIVPASLAAHLHTLT